MSYYAIGRRSKAVRMTIEAPDLTTARANCEIGEVAILVEGRTSGTISSDGKSVKPASVDMVYEGDKIKAARFVMLQSCDWTDLPSAPLTADKKAEWAAYRQALRDITETQRDVTFDEVIWPDEPAK